MGLPALNQHIFVFVLRHDIQQASPVARFTRQHYITGSRIAADENFGNVETEFQWQADCLTTSGSKYFCGLVHLTFLYSMVFSMIYTMERGQ